MGKIRDRLKERDRLRANSSGLMIAIAILAFVSAMATFVIYALFFADWT